MKHDLMKDRLFKLLRRKWVTPVSALNEAQCFSLAQRVSMWRAAGINIDKKWVDLPSGKRVRAYRIAPLSPEAAALSRSLAYVLRAP